MSVGGNKKFREFMSQYDLDQETIDYKYKTQAAEFYRKKVNLICFLDLFYFHQLLDISKPNIFYFRSKHVQNRYINFYDDINVVPVLKF